MEAEFRDKYVSDKLVFNIESSDYEDFINQLRSLFGEDRKYYGVFLTKECPKSVDGQKFVEVELQFFETGIFVLIRVHDLYILAFRKKSDTSRRWFLLNFGPPDWKEFIQKVIPNVVKLGYGESYGDLGGLQNVKMGFNAVTNAVQTLDYSSNSECFKRPLGLLCVFLSESVRDQEISANISQILRDFKEMENFGSKWENKILSWSRRSKEVSLEHMTLRNNVLTPKPVEEKLQKATDELITFGMIHHGGYEEARVIMEMRLERENKRPQLGKRNFLNDIKLAARGLDIPCVAHIISFELAS